MKPIIEVHNISKRYKIGAALKAYNTVRDSLTSLFKSGSDPSKEFWALKDVSFDVQAGESIGIIGKNGAGKSTLLKVLSRITPPTKGSITLRGRVASLLEVGTGFHPELTGTENIYLNGSILGLSRAEIRSRFHEIVEFSGVQQFLETPLKHYSSGMQLRLAFAVAAHLNPEILVIDEVLAVGDAEFQQKCLGKMGEVAESGRTILFVSHNMAAVNKLCSKAVLLEKGQVKTYDTTAKAFEMYLSKKDQQGLVTPDVIEGAKADLLEVGIKNDSGQYTDVVASDKHFYVTCKIRVHEPVTHCQIAVALMSLREGVIVFSSGHRDHDINLPDTLEKGEYQVSVKVPGHFLNIGMYAPNIRIWGSSGAGIRKSEAESLQELTFNIIETDSIAAKFADKRGGVVTPILEWTIH